MGSTAQVMQVAEPRLFPFREQVSNTDDTQGWYARWTPARINPGLFCGGLPGLMLRITMWASPRAGMRTCLQRSTCRLEYYLEGRRPAPYQPAAKPRELCPLMKRAVNPCAYQPWALLWRPFRPHIAYNDVSFAQGGYEDVPSALYMPIW